MMDTQQITATRYGVGRAAWQSARRLLINTEAVPYEQAMAHLAVSAPRGMVVLAQRGPRGDWGAPRFLSAHDPRPARGKVGGFSWYLVVRWMVSTEEED